MSKRKHAIIGLCLVAVITVGVNACRVQGSGLSSLSLARTTQALSQGAFIGAQMHFDNRQLERQLNPNPIVGEHIYLRYCDSCHGFPDKAPRLEGRYDTSPSNESDVNIVRYGLITMPGFSSKLTNFQIYDVLAYLESIYLGEKPKDKSEDDSAK